MQRDSTSPKAYRAAVEGEQSEILEALRGVIHDVAPKIDEGIRYGMLDYPGLANLAATVLDLMGLEAPEDYEPSLLDHA